MGLISLVLPSVGEKVTASDPRIVTAFSTLQTVINGNLNTENLENSAVTSAKIAASFKEALPIATGQTYGAKTSRTLGTEYEPSTTRAAVVVIGVTVTEGSLVSHPLLVHVGAVELPPGPNMKAESERSMTFIVPAGVKWKAECSGGSSLTSSYLLL